MNEIIVYPDTNFYMDHFDGRVDNLRPLGEFAFQILRRIFECEFKVVISPLVLKELFYNTYEEKIKELMNDLKEKNKVIKIEVSEEDVKKARQISKERNTSFNDTLHAVIANKAKAEYLITRNVKDFEDLQDLVKIAYPENL